VGTRRISSEYNFEIEFTARYMEGNLQVSQEKKTFKNLLQQFLHQVKKTIGQGRSENNQSSAAYFVNVPGWNLLCGGESRVEPIALVAGWLHRR